MRCLTYRCCKLLVAIACTACRIGFEITDSDASPDVPPGYSTIGGTVSGLDSAGLVLQNNGSDDLMVRMNGAFAFATPIMDGQAYDITLRTPPADRVCVIANGKGTVASGPVTDIGITCFPAGTCPASPITFTTNDTFTLPAGCTIITVEAFGGGGAGGGKNAGVAAAAGGAGGRAVATFAGLTPGTSFEIAIGLGGVCASTVATAGGYEGGRGGDFGGSGNGGAGAGASAPPGGLGGAGSSGAQPGGAGGNGGYGGGGGGGGGDQIRGNSGGGATVFRLASPATDYVVAGGGGAAGAADQNGDVAGAGGDACNGSNGANGAPAGGGIRSGGGGGGGACACLGGSCDGSPTSTGAAGGIAGTSGGCTSAQNGAAGHVVITFP